MESQPTWQLHQEFKKRGLRVLGVALDRKRDDLENSRTDEFNWPQLFDGQGFEGKIARD